MAGKKTKVAISGLEVSFTTIESRMLEVLSDGMPHPVDKLHGCVYTGARDNVATHISNIRKKIRILGEDIVIYYIKGKTNYMRVKLLNSRAQLVGPSTDIND